MCFERHKQDLLFSFVITWLDFGYTFTIWSHMKPQVSLHTNLNVFALLICSPGKSSGLTRGYVEWDTVLNHFPATEWCSAVKPVHRCKCSWACHELHLWSRAYSPGVVVCTIDITAQPGKSSLCHPLRLRWDRLDLSLSTLAVAHWMQRSAFSNLSDYMFGRMSINRASLFVDCVARITGSALKTTPSSA